MSPEEAEEMFYFGSIFTVRVQEIFWHLIPLHDDMDKRTQGHKRYQLGPCCWCIQPSIHWDSRGACCRVFILPLFQGPLSWESCFSWSPKRNLNVSRWSLGWDTPYVYQGPSSHQISHLPDSHRWERVEGDDKAPKILSVHSATHYKRRQLHFSLLPVHKDPNNPLSPVK